MSNMADETPRAAAYLAEQRAVLAKRQAMARRLLAPPGPRLATRAGWAPIRNWMADRRTVGGDRGVLGR